MPEVNVPEKERGPTREYLVRFDEPQLDCDGDFRAAVICEKVPTAPLMKFADRPGTGQ